MFRPLGVGISVRKVNRPGNPEMTEPTGRVMTLPRIPPALNRVTARLARRGTHTRATQSHFNGAQPTPPAGAEILGQSIAPDSRPGFDLSRESPEHGGGPCVSIGWRRFAIEDARVRAGVAFLVSRTESSIANNRASRTRVSLRNDRPVRSAAIRHKTVLDPLRARAFLFFLVLKLRSRT